MALIPLLKEAANKFHNVGKRFVSWSYLHFSNGTQWSSNDWEPSSRARKETAARSEKMNEQHIWSHRSHHHQQRRQMSEITTGDLKSIFLLSVNMRQLLPRCRKRRPFVNESTRSSRENWSSPNPRGNIDGCFQFGTDVDKLCKSHPLYTGQSGVLLWYTQWHKLWQGRRQCLMKTNKGFICKVKGVFMLFKQSHSSEGYVTLRYTDRCITELMLAF